MQFISIFEHKLFGWKNKKVSNRKWDTLKWPSNVKGLYSYIDSYKIIMK